MLNEYFEKIIEQNETEERLREKSFKIEEEERAFHYMDEKDILQETLEEYIKKLNSTENFFDYFNGYEDETTGEFIEGHDIYSANWTLSDTLRGAAFDSVEYVGVRALTGFGGPNLYIDTVKGIAGINWGFKNMELPLEHETIERLDNYFEEVFEYRIKYR